MKPFNIEDYLKNPTRRVVTRGGRPARIIRTDARGEYPVVALVEYDDASDDYTYTKDGIFSLGESGEEDLFFAPEKHEGWVNIYKAGNNMFKCSFIWSTEEDAKKEGNKWDDYVATVKIEWED